MWILPTLGRPKECAEVIASMIARGITTQGILVVNGTEDEDAYRQIPLPSNWTIEVLPENIGACGAMRKAFADYPQEPWYGLICDDEYVFTDQFDKLLIEAAGDWCISHGNDGVPGNIHTYVAIGGELVRSVGFWAIDELWHGHHDRIWQKIGYGLGLIRFCSDVQTEHRTFDYQTVAEKDATYALKWQQIELDDWLYANWIANEWPTIHRRLAAMKLPQPDYSRMNGMQIELGGGVKAKGHDWINMDCLDVADIKHDLNILPWPIADGQVDAVYSSHCIEHVTSPIDFIREIARICRVGASVEIACPDSQSDMAMCAGHISTFSQTQVRHFEEFPQIWFGGLLRKLTLRTTEYGRDHFWFDKARSSGLFVGWTDEDIMNWVPRTKHENRFKFVVEEYH